MKTKTQSEPTLRSDQGSSLVELALVLPFLFLHMLGAAGMGQAYFMDIEVATPRRLERCTAHRTRRM